MADYYISQGGSRILNATRVDQSSADNANVADWVKTNDFIIAININSNGKDTVAAQYLLRWRNKTDGGSFANVGAATEINYNADTSLVNGDPIAVGGRKCDSQGGDTWSAGEEVEGASLSDSIDLADEYETEIHFALDCSGATNAKEYEFELYDSTLGVTRGTCGATITMEAGAAAGWLSGWSYRKEITITGQSGAGTLYQVDLNVGDSAGGDFHLEGNCTNFPQDIQVTDNDGTTLLDYWIEDITTDPLKMWVEVADDLGSNQTIYVYYGKSGATTNSNIGDTFLFGDDAESGTYSDKWADITGTGEYSTDDYYTGSKSIKFSSTADQTSATKNTAFSNAVFEAMVKNSVQDPGYYTMFTARSSETAQTYYAYRANYTDDAQLYNRITGTFELLDFDASSDSLITWHKWSILCNGTSIKTYFDDALRNEVTNGDIASGGIGTRGTAGNNQYYDNVRIRKYNSPEPAFSSAGSEETPPTGVSPTAVFYGPLVGPLGGPI